MMFGSPEVKRKKLESWKVKKMEVLAKFRLSEKKYEKSHFMLIFKELLVCRLQKRPILTFCPIWKKGD